MDRLIDESPEFEQFPLNFHLTSIYDHSLREAISRVLHKLIDSLPFLEELLNVFCSVCAFIATCLHVQFSLLAEYSIPKGFPIRHIE